MLTLDQSLSLWKQANLIHLTQSLECAILQQSDPAVTPDGRRLLAERTREFKRADPDTQLKHVPGLIKLYQVLYLTRI